MYIPSFGGAALVATRRLCLSVISFFLSFSVLEFLSSFLLGVITVEGAKPNVRGGVTPIFILITQNALRVNILDGGHLVCIASEG